MSVRRGVKAKRTWRVYRTKGLDVADREHLSVRRRDKVFLRTCFFVPAQRHCSIHELQRPRSRNTGKEDRCPQWRTRLRKGPERVAERPRQTRVPPFIHYSLRDHALGSELTDGLKSALEFHGCELVSLEIRWEG
jgi:hypothetical protein